MLTMQDCLDYCDITPEELEAIAEHEHLDKLHAVAKAGYLMNCSGGERMVRQMIIEDIRTARQRGDQDHETFLKEVFQNYIVHHPRHPLS